MMLSAASILANLGLTWLLHRGDYAHTAPSRSASQEVLEAVVVAAALLVVRHLPLNVLGQTGWLGTYLAFGLLAPVVLERFVRRRSWAAVGWRKPTNQQALAIGFGLLALYALSALYRTLILGAPYYFDWGRLAYYAAFAYVEEALFRGVVQTRLESAWSQPRAWIVSGLFFGLYHWYGRFLVPGRALTVSGALQLASTTAFGMLLGVLFAKTRSLLPPFLIHLANNLYAS